MPDPTPSPRSAKDDQIRQGSGLSGSSGTKPTRPLEAIDATTLRHMWRAGTITEAQYDAELGARDYTREEIARSKQIGVSTAASTRGQLTGSEQAGVNAQKNLPKPAPVANAAASGTAAGRAGGFATAENAGGDIATGSASGQAGGNAQMGGAQALSAAQGGGGGAPVKPKPVRWSTALNTWVRDTGRKDANGNNIVEEVARPPVPDGWSTGTRGDRGWLWDPVAKQYRQWEWDTDGQEFQPTDKVQALPQTLKRGPGGEALSTGKDVASGQEATPAGQALSTAGGAVAPPAEGFPSVAAGSGETPVFPVGPGTLPRLGMFGNQEISTQGIPMSTETDQMGQEFIGTTSGNIAEFRTAPGGGSIGVDVSQFLHAFGLDVTGNPIVDTRKYIEAQEQIARMQDAGLSMADIQEALRNPQRVPSTQTIPGSGLLNAMTGELQQRATSSGTRQQARIAETKVLAPLGGQKELPQAYARGGRMTLPEEVMVVGLRTNTIYATGGEEGAGTEDLLFIPKAVRSNQEGGEFDFAAQVDLAAQAEQGGGTFARGDNPYGAWAGSGRDAGSGETQSETIDRLGQGLADRARQEEETRLLAEDAAASIEEARVTRDRQNLDYRGRAGGLAPPTVIDLPIEVQGRVPIPPGITPNWLTPEQRRRRQLAAIPWAQLMQLAGGMAPEFSPGNVGNISGPESLYPMTVLEQTPYGRRG